MSAYAGGFVSSAISDGPRDMDNGASGALTGTGSRNDGRNCLALRRTFATDQPRHGSTTMLDCNEHRSELDPCVAELGRPSPDPGRGYATLSKTGGKTNHLDAKTREMIGWAVAVTARCAD